MIAPASASGHAVSRHATRLYGLQICSGVPLFGSAVGLEPGSPVDLDIRLGEPIEPTTDAPQGFRLAEVDTPGMRYWVVRADDGTITLRYPGLADFVISADLRRVESRPARGSDPGLIEVMVTGSVPACVLTLLGAPLLHASAVDVGGRAAAFVGHSGTGKSTMAALVCAAGGRLISDDVLRVDLAGPHPRCHLGAVELRLRPAAAGLADHFAKSLPTRRTSDGRHALLADRATEDLLPLAAIVLPRPDRRRRDPVVRKLHPADALAALIRYPRMVGWTDPATLAAQFHHLASMCEQVAVYEAEIPWGPPFPPGLAGAVLAEVGLGESLPSR